MLPPCGSLSWTIISLMVSKTASFFEYKWLMNIHNISCVLSQVVFLRFFLLYLSTVLYKVVHNTVATSI